MDYQNMIKDNMTIKEKLMLIKLLVNDNFCTLANFIIRVKNNKEGFKRFSFLLSNAMEIKDYIKIVNLYL